MVKMQHTAHCIQPLRESRLRAALQARRRRCSRIIWSHYACTDATAKPRRRVMRRTQKSSHGRNGFCACEVPLFLASERCTNTKNSIGSICTAHAHPALSTCAAKSSQLHACKLDALARNRRATLVRGCISYIDTTHESNLCRTHVLVPQTRQHALDN